MANVATAMLTLPVSSRDHMQGSPLAPVILVEYGDYECPFCGQAYLVVKEVQRLLGKQLCFVFRNFPLSAAHPHAEHAAEAAEAAAASERRQERRERDTYFLHQRHQARRRLGRRLANR